MKFFPFIFKSIILNGDSVSFIKMVNDRVLLEKKLTKSTTPKKYFNYDIDCKCRENSFVIGPHLFSFRTNLSLLPIVRCKIVTTQKNEIKLELFIYPFLAGMLTNILAYAFCLFVVYTDISKGNSPLPTIGLMLSIYVGMMYFFNVRSKEYLLYLDSIIENYGKRMVL